MDTAKQAIIMAAGFGSRLRPVTESIPKPLVSVRSARILDTTIEALRKNGISRIIVVTGYLSECFQGLEEKYPGVKLVHNPDYAAGNSITSLYHAREYMTESAILMDGDIIVVNPDILKPDIRRSCYCCMWMDTYSDEWILHETDGIVTGCQAEGGTGWALRSVSLWTREDILRMRRQLTEAYEKDGLRNVFWDQIPIFCHPEDYEIGIRPIALTDLVEIDTLEDLCRMDPTYLTRKEEKK